MKVKDYVALIEQNGDGVGSKHKLTPIGAKGIALVCMLKPDIASDKVDKLPYAAQWSLLENVLASEEIKEINKFCEDFLKNLGEKEITKGVKSMLSGTSFVIPVEIGTSTYGINMKPSEDKFIKIRDAVLLKTKSTDLPDILQKGMHSEDFALIIKSISTLNSSPVVLAELPTLMGEMDYINFFKLVTILMGLNAAVYKLDWDAILKK